MRHEVFWNFSFWLFLCKERKNKFDYKGQRDTEQGSVKASSSQPLRRPYLLSQRNMVICLKCQTNHVCRKVWSRPDAPVQLSPRERCFITQQADRVEGASAMRVKNKPYSKMFLIFPFFFYWMFVYASVYGLDGQCIKNPVFKMPLSWNWKTGQSTQPRELGMAQRSIFFSGNGIFVDT